MINDPLTKELLHLRAPVGKPDSADDPSHDEDREGRQWTHLAQFLQDDFLKIIVLDLGALHVSFCPVSITFNLLLNLSHGSNFSSGLTSFDLFYLKYPP